MTWRNKLIPASFRGANFGIISHDHGFGRRNVIHQYPFQDVPFVEDLGKDSDDYIIQGFVIQKPPAFNYWIDRNALKNALIQEGPGRLTHPYLGVKRVSLVGKARMIENTQEGGIARFSMTFTEAGEKKFPSNSTGFSLSTALAALQAINRAVDSFVGYFDSAFAAVDDINAAFAGMKNAINTIKGLPAAVASSAISLIDTAADTITSVITSPCDLANSIIDGFEGIKYAAGLTEETFTRGIESSCAGLIENEDDAERPSNEPNMEEGESLVTASLNMMDFTVLEITAESPNSAQAEVNRRVLVDLVNTAGAAISTQIAISIQYDNSDDADKVLKSITGKLDAMLLSLGAIAGNNTVQANNIAYSNDEIYQSIKELRPAFVKGMIQLGASLADVVEYRVGQDAQNILTLAYDKYEDLDRAAGIVERNKTTIIHPGFMPGGSTINILSA